MFSKLLLQSILVISLCFSVFGQVINFGKCAEAETMHHFDLERFLGQWYEIARFPAWYEHSGACAYKRLNYCARRIEIEHVFVKNWIRFVLHINSTYIPGAEAVFDVQNNNIDPLGIPLTVISTDYTNYAIVYGCKNDEEMGLRYISAWILSRNTLLDPEVYHKAVLELNSIPGANAVFLETVVQDKDICPYFWTAHVNAENEEDNENTKYTKQ